MSEGPDRGQRSTRDLILDEAVACFAERGYDGTSLNDIAAGVGIRRPSLLHHFASKEVLYGNVFERILSDWLERVSEAVEMDGTGWDKVELVLRAGFALFEDHPDYVRMMRREALDGGVRLGIDLASVLKPLFEAAAEYLDEMMSAGKLRRHDSRHLLIMGYGAILSYFSDAPFITDLLEDDALTSERIRVHREAVVTFFRSALT
ncbi:MAG: TetR family transcriptional regulator [Actinobacteria bacterium]|nr:TetR family transcriptional regulator [Actinomycetota bacterium]NBR67907.1 TetR family transcriptional regulator [Actinomycetota bacterium]NBU15396.1 TetR family transcriptional regulator [Actinomycetota bacterium]